MAVSLLVLLVALRCGTKKGCGKDSEYMNHACPHTTIHGRYMPRGARSKAGGVLHGGQLLVFAQRVFLGVEAITL